MLKVILNRSIDKFKEHHETFRRKKCISRAGLYVLLVYELIVDKNNVV